MTKFEIGTCYMRAPSSMDAAKVAETVAEFVDQEEGTAAYNGGAMFALRTTEVFFGTRRAHTNVNFTAELPDYKTAVELRNRLFEATGQHWNSPTEDMDEVEERIGRTWGMFSEDGARKVQASLDLLEGHLRSGALSPIKLAEAVEIHCKAIASEGHSEVFDTAVREEIWDRLDQVCDELGVHLTVR